jgi:crotonobetaine/carnitine-CoA ligase
MGFQTAGPATAAPGRSLRALVGQDDATIAEVLAARVTATPERPFLLWEGRRWSYAESFGEIRRFAGFLANLPGGTPARVIGYLGNGPEALWAWLGSVWAGAVWVPLNRQHVGAVLADQLERAASGGGGEVLLVTEGSGVDALPARLAGVEAVLLEDGAPVPATWPVRHGWSEVSAASPAGATRRAAGGVATVMFTSGTTGRSKAARLPHNLYCRNAGRLVDGFGLTADDVFHNWLPLHHLGGQLHMTMTAIVAGGTVALFPGFSTTRFRDEVARTGATVICGFAAILHFIWSLPPDPADATSTLRVGIIGGVPPNLQAPFERRFGMRLGENYGMTEADPITLPTPGIDAGGTSGFPGGDFEVAILDDQDRSLGPDSLGEIAIRPRAPWVMSLGYEGDEEVTVRRWRNLWFHTGDIGSLDAAGRLHFRGRAQHYIRRRGENISAAEVEGILTEHPEVAECAVVGVRSTVGEEDVKAVIVRVPGSAVTAAALRDYATERMARFMVPRYLEFRDRLPRNDMGKVQTAALGERVGELWDAAASE